MEAGHAHVQHGDGEYSLIRIGNEWRQYEINGLDHHDDPVRPGRIDCLDENWKEHH